MSTLDAFRIDGRAAVITGGGGLLGAQHASAIADAGGRPIIWDIDKGRADATVAKLGPGSGAVAMAVDITDAAAVSRAVAETVTHVGRIHILINNAAHDPKVGAGDSASFSRVESMSPEAWTADLAVGLTGAFFCSQHVGTHMASAGGGVILNIASDLALISPDQRLYEVRGREPSAQPVKPASYSVVKHGLVGLTKYLATYWAHAGVRVNAISPGGMHAGQDEEFVARLSQLIPMGRMAKYGEYQAAVLFLVSDASSYMTGTNLVVDGGRTCW